MKILHVSTGDQNGGAARAAYRLHRALLAEGVHSRMLVNWKISGDWTVTATGGTVAQVMRYYGLSGAEYFATRIKAFFQTENPIKHSLNLFSWGTVRQINRSDADVVVLHWINNGMLSIRDIAKIKKPIVWLLHDQWAFCGAEHYTADYLQPDRRYIDGYHKTNRPSYEKGLDLCAWTWRRKMKHWPKANIRQIVCPSRWLADCAKKSALFKNCPVSEIANTIDVDKWQPLEKRLARQLLQLPVDKPLLLFGACFGRDGTTDIIKGSDLLLAAIEEVRGRIAGLELVVFGQSQPQQPPQVGVPIHYTGHLHDDLSLRVLYSAADVMAIPSRRDNLPNTGLEAHACATPVVAFDVCGLPSIVTHKVDGYLAKPFDQQDLAEGILWTMAQVRLHDAGGQGPLEKAARQAALARYAAKEVVPQYLKAFEAALRLA